MEIGNSRFYSYRITREGEMREMTTDGPMSIRRQAMIVPALMSSRFRTEKFIGTVET